MTTTAPSRVSLHPLHMRAEHRDGDASWVIGRADTGDFIAVPQVGADVITLLRDGLTVEQTHERILTEHGRDIDVADFVTGLIDLGFVRSVDGVLLPGAPLRPSTLPWLKADHVRWLLSAPTALLAAALLGAAAVTLLVQPHLLPSYRDLFWTGHISVALAGNAVAAWSILALHELAHLITARASGVGGRIGLGTRLQFLVAQTDVSGIWAVSQRRRVAVYLSGMACDLLVASAAITARAALGPDTATGRFAGAVAVLALLFLPAQMLIFMRTDMYFLLQDLSGCRNLYTDGSAYLRSQLRRLQQPAAWRRTRPDTALHELSGRERRAVRVYAIVLIAGTLACLAVAIAVTVPFTWSVITRAAAALADPQDSGARVDALITAGILGAYWTLWATAWWRRHGPRVTGALRRLLPQTSKPIEGR